MYLTLQMLRDQFENNPNVRFREEIVGGVSVTIVCYMISDDSLWKEELGVETRGACFDTESGQLLALPFEKFFNVNEKEHTQANIVAEEMSRTAPEVCAKVDGSMINAVVINDNVYLKTKKTFSSDVALAAQAAMTPGVEALARQFVRGSITPIFEFYSPDSKIVVNYGDEPQFSLIAGRCMVTGEYISQSALDYWAHFFKVNRHPWSVRHDLGGMIAESATAENIEGWVIYLPSGRYKVKTKWYMDRHRLIDIRERDIARFAIEETLDDMIPDLIEGGADMETIRKIEHNVATDLAHIFYEIESMGNEAKQVPDGKERADWVKAKAGELQGFVFRASRDLNISDSAVKEFYTKKYLSQYSLRSVGNPNFRTEEDIDA